MATWQQKIGKRLMKHVAETTERKTLTEVKSNLEFHRALRIKCFECEKIAQKLKLV